MSGVPSRPVTAAGPRASLRIEDPSLEVEEVAEAGRLAVERIGRSREGLNPVLWAKADDMVCHCRVVSKATIITAVARGARTLREIQTEIAACTGRWCEAVNPKKTCCRPEIDALLEAYSKREGSGPSA